MFLRSWNWGLPAKFCELHKHCLIWRQHDAKNCSRIVQYWGKYMLKSDISMMWSGFTRWRQHDKRLIYIYIHPSASSWNKNVSCPRTLWILFIREFRLRSYPTLSQTSMISLNKGSLLNQIIFGLTDNIDNRNKPMSKARFQKKIKKNSGIFH